MQELPGSWNQRGQPLAAGNCLDGDVVRRKRTPKVGGRSLGKHTGAPSGAGKGVWDSSGSARQAQFWPHPCPRGRTQTYPTPR